MGTVGRYVTLLEGNWVLALVDEELAGQIVDDGTEHCKCVVGLGDVGGLGWFELLYHNWPILIASRQQVGSAVY